MKIEDVLYELLDEGLASATLDSIDGGESYALFEFPEDVTHTNGYVVPAGVYITCEDVNGIRSLIFSGGRVQDGLNEWAELSALYDDIVGVDPGTPIAMLVHTGCGHDKIALHQVEVDAFNDIAGVIRREHAGSVFSGYASALVRSGVTVGELEQLLSTSAIG